MPITRPQPFRVRRIATVSLLIVLAGGGAYLPTALIAPVAATPAVSVAYSPPVGTSPALAFPSYGASAVGAVGFDGVLASSGDTAPRSIASISKIILALTVLDAHPLAIADAGPAITLTAADAALVGKYMRAQGTTEPVVAGAALSQRQVLEVVLVASANNYAETLAGWAFGSQAGYVTAARAWLGSRGFTHTTIVEPTGMSAKNTSTAEDLIGIGKLALANPVVAKIVGSASVTVPGIGAIRNSNELLGIDGVDGIKTGTLAEAGACLLFSADVHVGSSTVTVIGVALGGVDHRSLDVGIRSLLASAAAGFHEVKVVTKGQVFASYAAPWGSTSTAVAAADRSVIIWGNTPVAAAVTTTAVGSARSGASVGSVRFSAGKRSTTVPLVLSRTIAAPDGWWKVTHPQDLFEN